MVGLGGVFGRFIFFFLLFGFLSVFAS